MISIAEQFMHGKRADNLECEDGYFISENFVVVVDGVTSKGKLMWDGNHTSGYFAKELILKSVKEIAPDTAKEDFFKIVTEAVFAGYGERLGIAMENVEEQLQAHIIVYSDFFRQIWSYGDCQCIINGVWHSHEKEVDSITSNMRSLLLELEILKGKSIEQLIENDVGRAYILPLLTQQNLLSNHDGPFGFYNINGLNFRADKIVCYDIEENSELVLASDGYPTLMNTLEESEKNLSDVLKNDPLCFRQFRSTKGIKNGNVSFDDRTYIRFIV